MSRILKENLRQGTLAAFFFLLSCSLKGQTIYQGSLHYGRVLKISNGTPPNTGHSTYFDLGAAWPASGKQLWHHLHGFPEVGLSAYFFELGNPDLLGKAVGFAPSITFDLVKKSSWKFQFKIAYGLGYISKPHHPNSNSGNRVIGSHINNLTELKFQFLFRPERHWQYLFGASYPHFSNAHSSVPNVGLNIPSVFAGVRFQPKLQEAHVEPSKRPEEQKGFKIYPGIKLAYGITETKVSAGPKYPVYLGEFYLSTAIKHKFRLKLGGEYLYSHAVRAFLENQDVEVKNRDQASTAIAVYGGIDIMLKRVSMVFQLGPYLKKTFGQQYSILTKMGIQYHWFDQNYRDRRQPFIGIYVHSHSGEADFLELGMGYLF